MAERETPNLSVVLTIRLLMQGKEVGSIIGKRGDHIKVIRDESGAKINISDGSCPERIVTITGNLDTITKAFTMICHKFEDDMTQLPNSVPKPPITFRLIVPATQCGSLIGKGGAKIKEIRDASGASLQVASEMLPNSAERAVTISGTANAVIECMHHICQILLESPPKGVTISYRPKPSVNPLLLASSAAAAAAAQQPVLASTANAAIYNQLAATELTKMHSAYNPLLQPIPGFNPAVLNGSSGNPYAPSLIQFQGAGGQHLFQAVTESTLNNMAALSASSAMNNGSYGRALDVRQLNGVMGSRDDVQKLNAALMAGAGCPGADAAHLSQYLSGGLQLGEFYPSLLTRSNGSTTMTPMLNFLPQTQPAAASLTTPLSSLHQAFASVFNPALASSAIDLSSTYEQQNNFATTTDQQNQQRQFYINLINNSNCGAAALSSTGADDGTSNNYQRSSDRNPKRFSPY